MALDLSINDRNESRTFWTTAYVRASDLRGGDVARLSGVWRWIYGVDEEGDESVAKLREDLPDIMCVIRHAVDEKSTTDTYEDALLTMTTTTLVEIQVPVDNPPLNLRGSNASEGTA